MPELPEVEITINYLRPKIVGRAVKGIWTDWPKAIGNISFEELNKILRGKKFSAIQRRGKNILIEVDKKFTLWIHLKMTGHLLIIPAKIPEGSPLLEKVNQYLHFKFLLDEGEELAFSDLRKFGRVRYLAEPITDNLITNNFKDLGIEPLEKDFTLDKLVDLVEKNKNKPLKLFLMDQSQIAGIGNIYASEIPFDAKLSPKRKIGDLSKAEIKALYLSIKKILKKAVDTRGTSVSDFRDPEGKPGGYGNIRKVYQRKSQPCPGKCGGAVESFKQGQRTTFWCPKCQK